MATPEDSIPDSEEPRPDETGLPDPYDDPPDPFDDDSEDEPGPAPVPTAEQAAPLSTIEVILDERADEDDVWGYCNEIVERNVPREFRQQFYERWIAMVATRQESERDALLAHGQPVFRYRIDTARKSVEALRRSGASVLIVAPSVVCPEFIAEMVHRPGQSPVASFLVKKRRKEGEPNVPPEIADYVEIGETRYHVPAVASLLGAKPALLLPTEAVAYETSEKLLIEIVAFISEYVKLKNAVDVKLAALYCRYTWIADKVPVAPYLHVVGDFEAGKSRLLDVLGQLVRNGLFASGSLTNAVIYRALDLAESTIIIDEADFEKGDPRWSDILRVLLTGSTADRPVLRVDMDAKGDIRSFDPFGPKILCSKKAFPNPALESRCLDLQMLPNRLTEEERHDMAKILPPQFYERAQGLRNKLLAWRFDHVRDVTVDHYANFEGLTSMRVTQAAIALQAAGGRDSDGQLEPLSLDVLDRLKDKGKEIESSREESEEGLIATALLHLWDRQNGDNRPKKSDRVALKMIVDRIRDTTEWHDVQARDVAATIRKTLALACKRSNSQPRAVHLSPKQAERLRATYGAPSVVNARVRMPVR
jgi:hypothetical protein